MPHRYDVAVRWSDEDRLGHVNNSRYLTFTEDARLSWLADSPAGNGSVILARTEIDFIQPVHFVAGGLLVVLTWVLAVGNSSVRLRQDVVGAPDNTPVTGTGVQAVARTEHVLVRYDYEQQRSRHWADGERTWLRRWIAEGASI